MLREDYPVRTADSEGDALASIDGNVTVLVVDVTNDEFDLDRIVEAGRDLESRFQLAAIVTERPTPWLCDRCDGFAEKSAGDQELRTTVRWLHRRGRYDRTLAAYYALSEKYAALVTDPDASTGALRSLEEELGQLRDELDDIGDALEDGDAFEVALASDSPSSP